LWIVEKDEPHPLFFARVVDKDTFNVTFDADTAKHYGITDFCVGMAPAAKQ
jgi:hypothetical protein